MAVGNKVGKFICVDEANEQRTGMDVAMILVETPHPIWQASVLQVQVDGKQIKVLVEQERTMHAYDGVVYMPTTPVTEHRLGLQPDGEV